MQFKLTFSLKFPLTIPLAYHDKLQGLIYDILSYDPEYSEFLHNTGYKFNNHSFKLFAFSLLNGDKKVEPPNITFYDRISFEIRSPLPAFCNVLSQAVVNKEQYILADNPIFLESCSISKSTIDRDMIRIKMLSPLCLHSTYYEGGKRKTHYYTPLDPETNDILNQNLKNKYMAAYNKPVNNDVFLSADSLNQRDKYVTKFNSKIYITAWNGTYTLQGSPEVLTFLYDTGLGDRNSAGFGMFTTF